MQHILSILAVILQLALVVPLATANVTQTSGQADPNNLQQNSPAGQQPVKVTDFLPDNAPSTTTLGVGADDLVKQAEGTGNLRQGSIGRLDVAGTIKNVLSIATGALASVASLYALFMVLRHAFGYATSQGDSGKMGEAQKGIIDALIALLIISFSYLIVMTIINTVGLLAGL